MGALTSNFGNVLPLLSATAATANTFNNNLSTLLSFGSDPNKQLRQEQDLALQQLQARQKLQERQLGEQSALERERLAVQARQDEDARRQALRRAVARRRAQFGASGIGNSGGGSSDAVLLGLFEETDDELARREELDNLRSRALDTDFAQTRSLNVLQATQLAERQNLQRLF